MPKDAIEVAEALVEWVKATCPDLKGAYDYDPATKTQPLPDVAASASDEVTVQNDGSLGIPFATFGIDQAVLNVTRVTILLMVEEEPAEEADAALKGFVRDLKASIFDEMRGGGIATLDGRLPAISPFTQASYEPPFIQFDDGTKGRAATFSVVVAELV